MIIGGYVLRYHIIPVTHFQQNCSLISCDVTGKAAFVDPGGEPEKLHRALGASGLTLDKILLTHGHMDHVGAAAELAAHYSVPIIGPHRDDVFWLNMLDTQAQMMGFAPVPAPEPTRFLTDGEQVTLGEVKLDVLHCPGHTPGHVVLVDKHARLAFVGDVLFKGAVGRSDFPRGDHATLVRSITQKLWPLGDDIQFVPGHGPMSSFAHERIHNPFVADKRVG